MEDRCMDLRTQYTEREVTNYEALHGWWNGEWASCPDSTVKAVGSTRHPVTQLTQRGHYHLRSAASVSQTVMHSIEDVTLLTAHSICNHRIPDQRPHCSVTAVTLALGTVSFLPLSSSADSVTDDAASTKAVGTLHRCPQLEIMHHGSVCDPSALTCHD